jgi:SIR2-like domain
VELFEREDERSPKIPYPAIAGQLFPSDRKQSLVPFLGAGASLGPSGTGTEPPVTYPDQADVDQALGALGFSGTARLFMQLAVRLAAKIQTVETAAASGIRPPNPLDVAAAAKYPPSAGQLASALAFLAEYDGFERPRRRVRTWLSAADSELVTLLRWIADLTEIGPSVPPLLSVASYYEFTLQRANLWQQLRHIFENKQTPTRTHWLIARAAEHHLSRRPWKDYLIITTNYDRLMELALEKTAVPYCVLAVANADQHVDVRFSAGLQKYLQVDDREFASLKEDHARKYPNRFTLELPKPVAIVYKIHGCLYPELPDRDSVVLSDEDYIRYLMQMYDAGGMIPSQITALTELAGFLFLGYSFSDWNVRAIYNSVVKQRTASKKTKIKDFAVVREVSHYEAAFCHVGDDRISLLLTDLSRFARRILRHAPARPRQDVAAAPAP